MSSWSRGYGDFAMKPDLDTLRPIPWQRGHGDGDGRHPLARRSSRSPPPRARSCAARSSGSPSAAGRRSPAPSSSSSSSTTPTRTPGARPTATSSRPTSTTSTTRCSAPSRVEPLIRRIRNSMMGAEMVVENSKGECNLGQHEINFLFADALSACDEHVIYKNGAKEIAAQEGFSITFMAKFNEAEGNSCHIHCSLADEDGENVFGNDETDLPPLPRRPARLHARDDAVLRAADQLLQALRRAARSRRPRSPGARTTGPARSASSATAPRCASRTGCRAPTSTPTWRWRR